MAKVKKDPRHKRRQETIQSLFAWGFNQTTPLTKSAKKVVAEILQIDQIIKNSAPKWPLDKINKTDLAILRLAIYELKFDQEIPEKVSIDEAVELAKEFGSENSPGFVNGALGAAYTIISGKENNEPEKTTPTGKKNKDNL